MSNRKILIIIILVIATCLRFYKLELRSLWYDEASKISSATSENSFTEFLQHRNIKKPIYILLLKIWIMLFGMSEFSVRSLTVIFGILSIFFLYLLASELFSPSVGLLSLFLISISPFHIFYSQQNTEYNLLLLLIIISTLIFVKINKIHKKSLYLVYGIVNILICYTHIFGLYIILIHNIYFFLFNKKNFFQKDWLVTQAFLLTFILPFCIFIFSRGREANELNWITKPNIAVLLDTVKAMTYGGEKLAQGGTGFETNKNHLLFARLLLFICPLLLLKGIFSKNNFLFEKHPTSQNLLSRNKINLLLIWIIIPVLMTFIFSWLVFPIYVVRYLIIILPAYCMFLAIGILSFKNFRRRFIIIFLIATLISQALWVYFHPEESNSWRELASYVKKNISAEDILIFLPLKQILPFMYYFSDDRSRLFKALDIKGKKILGKWYDIFKEKDFLCAGVELGKLPYKMLDNNLFKTYEEEARTIFLVASPDWPGIGESVSIVRNYFLKYNWREEERSYTYPGVILLIYRR